MRSNKPTKKFLSKKLPPNSLYNQCMFTLATMASNARKEFDVVEGVDKLVLEVCKRFVPDDKDYILEEIISRLAMNMVYGWTEDIPF